MRCILLGGIRPRLAAIQSKSRLTMQRASAGATDLRRPRRHAVVLAVWAFVLVTRAHQANAGTDVFPNDGTSFQVDLVRRYSTAGVQGCSASATYSGGASQYTSNPADGAINGHLSDSPWRFKSDTGYPNATAQGVLVVDLKSQFAINRIRTLWSGDVNSYRIRLSTDNANWTEVVAPVDPASSADITATFGTVLARYVEVTATGLVGLHAGLNEVFVYPAATATSPGTGAGYDIGYLVYGGKVAVTLNSNWQAGNLGSNLLGGRTGTIRPQSIVAGQNSIATIDLGEPFALYQINLKFGVGGNKDWPNGGKVEIGLTDTPTYDRTVLDIATSLTHRSLRFSPQYARYIRITAYQPPATAGNHLQNVEIYSTGPKPPSGTCVMVR